LNGTTGALVGADTCPSGQALVGFNGYASGSVVGFQPVCAPLLAPAVGDGAGRTGARSALTLRGPTSSSRGSSLCPANQVVVGLAGRAGWGVDNLQVRCAPLSVLGGVITVGAASTQPGFGGTGGDPFGPSDCPAGKVANVSTVTTGYSV